jgi:hypothetical protein
MAEDWMPRGGYWLIDTIVDVSVDLPLEIVPNVRLERATDEQIEMLKSRIQVGNFENSIEYLREHDYVVVEQTENRKSWKSVALPRDKWRWLSIHHRGNGFEFLGSISFAGLLIRRSSSAL